MVPILYKLQMEILLQYAILFKDYVLKIYENASWGVDGVILYLVEGPSS